MRKVLLLIISVIILSGCLGLSSGPIPNQVIKSQINVIPRPRQIVYKDSGCVISPDWRILLESTSTELERRAAELISTDLESEYGINVPVELDDFNARTRPNAIVLGVPKRDKGINERAVKRGVVASGDALKPQGYVLSTEQDAIMLLGNDPDGVFYAAQTLRQVITQAGKDAAVPGLLITDYPIYRYRGVQMNISHNAVPTVEQFKYIIRTLALYKMNVLTFSVESTLDILTPDEIQVISADAKLHNIELIGNIQSGIPLESPDGQVLPGQDDYYDYLEKVYAKAIPAFESKYLHFNCADEISGSSTDNMLEFNTHIQRVMHLAQIYYKTPLFWGDMFLKYQALLAQIPDKSIIMNNTLDRKRFRLSIEAINKSGLGQFLCPNGYTEGQIFPVIDYARDNILEFCRAGLPFVEAGKPALGVVLELDDKAGPEFFETNWFNTLWTAECAWAPDKAEDDSFPARFSRSFFGIDSNTGYETVNLFNECNRLMGFPDDALSRLYEDPFISDFHLEMPEFYGRMDQVVKLSDDALKLLEQIKHKATRQEETISAWEYIAQQWQYMAYKFLMSHLVAKAYNGLYYPETNRPDEIKLEATITEYINILHSLRDKTDSMQSSRNAFAGKRYKSINEYKYAPLAKLFTEKSAKLKSVLETAASSKAVVLIPPAEIGFALKSFPERAISPEFAAPVQEVAKRFVWWEKDWPYRVFVRLENKVSREPLGANQFACPVEVSINFSKLLSEAFPEVHGLPVGVQRRKPDAGIDLDSIRVVEYNEAGVPLGACDCQADKQPSFDARKNALVNVFWALRGKTYMNTTRYFYIYFDVEGKQPKPKQEYKIFQIEPSGDNGIINKRIKAFISDVEGVIRKWNIRDISSGFFGSLDILEGKGKLLDIPSAKGTKFNLSLEAAGPLMVRYLAATPTGFYRRYTFYEDLPVVDIFCNAGLNQCLNYDSGDNFAKGHYMFSNYQTGQFKPERVNCAEAFWSCLKRKDGLTFGFITPDNRAGHYVTGKGTSGIDNKKGISHFVLYCDRTDEDTFNLMNRIMSAFTLTDSEYPPSRTLLIQRGRGESRE
ncbi:MAG: beta-N-acetylhexosaminidase [Planctomycetota bacterium]